MESDADRRFRRLAAAISYDADPEDDLPGLELDVTRRTFAYDVRREGRPVQRRRIAVLDAALEVGPLDGEVASEAWGEDLSDEDGWFRFALNGWYEDVATKGPSATGWWTLTGTDGAASSTDRRLVSVPLTMPSRNAPTMSDRVRQIIGGRDERRRSWSPH